MGSSTFVPHVCGQAIAWVGGSKISGRTFARWTPPVRTPPSLRAGTPRSRGRPPRSAGGVGGATPHTRGSPPGVFAGSGGPGLGAGFPGFSGGLAGTPISGPGPRFPARTRPRTRGPGAGPRAAGAGNPGDARGIFPPPAEIEKTGPGGKKWPFSSPSKRNRVQNGGQIWDKKWPFFWSGRNRGAHFFGYLIILPVGTDKLAREIGPDLGQIRGGPNPGSGTGARLGVRLGVWLGPQFRAIFTGSITGGIWGRVGVHFSREGKPLPAPTPAALHLEHSTLVTLEPTQQETVIIGVAYGSR